MSLLVLGRFKKCCWFHKQRMSVVQNVKERGQWERCGV